MARSFERETEQCPTLSGFSIKDFILAGPLVNDSAFCLFWPRGKVSKKYFNSFYRLGQYKKWERYLKSNATESKAVQLFTFVFYLKMKIQAVPVLAILLLVINLATECDCWIGPDMKGPPPSPEGKRELEGKVRICMTVKSLLS